MAHGRRHHHHSHQRHCRQLSDPLPFDINFSDNCVSSSSNCTLHSFPSNANSSSSTSFKVFKSCCFPLKLRHSSLNMANGHHPDCLNDDDDDRRSVNTARPDTRKKSVIGGQRKQELEQEVADLRKVLENEEKAHEVLERAMLRIDGRSQLHIPSFLPKKTKELLAELAMVEEEIARLESEITSTQKASDNESIDVVPQKQTCSTLTSLDQLLIHSADTTDKKAIEEKITLYTKPVFFINQAIRGDYSIQGFASNEKKRIPKKNAVIEKQSSPRPPRHTSPRLSDTNTEMLSKFLKEPLIAVNPKEKIGRKLQPNKLSEKIMKCLLCIFMRLVRTSRVSETEKSGNLSSLIIQKETAQQDPYGIFDMEDSLVRDIGPYKNLVRCSSCSLDVKGISSSLQLQRKLRGLLNELHDVDMRFLTHHQKLAFWINIYNTCIMHGFLLHGLPSSHEKIIALKSKAVLDIGGNRLNASAIEHFILRRSSNKKEGNEDDREPTVWSIYGLEQSEQNITFALCCGNRFSPSVRIYTAEGVSAELEKSKLEYLQASIVVTASKRIKIPKLLAANMRDFATDMGSLVEWICNQLPTSGSLRKSMAECLRGHSNSEQIATVVDVIPYDFEFQYLLPM